MSKPSAEKQPLINQKATIRMAVCLLIIAGAIGAYQWYQAKGGDISGGGQKDTAGWIGAIELDGRDSQVVVMKPDGSIERSPGYKNGISERDYTWRPDGNQIFFSSNRDGIAFNIYRWNLAMDLVEPKTLGHLGRTLPSFSAKPRADGDWPLLVISGGSVWELHPKDLTAEKVMPFEAGSTTSMSTDEKDTGDPGDIGAGRFRIRKAMWAKDGEWIVAVRRTDTGEVLVTQAMTGDAKVRTMNPIIFGDHIDFDVHPETGKVVATVEGFQWPDPAKPPPESIKNGKSTKPFLHAVIVFDPGDMASLGRVAYSLDNKQAFTGPKISPDGANVLIVAGAYEDGNVAPRVLASMPAMANGGEKGARISGGEIYEPSWHPNGHTVVYIKREDGKRNVYTAEAGGSSAKKISDGQKSYAHPQFSPQSK